MLFRSTSRMTGTSRPRSVSTATPMCYVLLVDDARSRQVDRRVELRELLQRGREDLEHERRHRQLAAGALRPAAPYFLRSSSSSVMSAWSCCVTCGIVVPRLAQLLRRLAADVAHRLALDLAPLGEVGQRRAVRGAPAAALRRGPPAQRPRTYACTSSTVMRPPGRCPRRGGCRRRARAPAGGPTGARGRRPRSTRRALGAARAAAISTTSPRVCGGGSGASSSGSGGLSADAAPPLGLIAAACSRASDVSPLSSGPVPRPRFVAIGARLRAAGALCANSPSPTSCAAGRPFAGLALPFPFPPSPRRRQTPPR